MPQGEAYEYVCTGCGNTARATQSRVGRRRRRCDACRAKERPGIARNTYECEACGASLAGRAANTRFCNQNCQKWARYNPGKKRPPPSASRACLACGTLFPRCGLKEFCSPLCSEVFHGNSKIGPRGGVIVCAICGKRKAVYMPATSKACRDCLPEWQARMQRAWSEANPERVREWYRQRSKTPKYRAYMAALQRRLRAERNPPRGCAHCGEPTVSRRRLCEECRRPLPVLSAVAYGRVRVAATPPPTRLFVMGWCLNDCEPYVMAPGKFRPETKFCCPECGKEYDRRKRKGSIGLIAVLVRYDFTCHLCLQRIDITEHPNSPRGATRDHVIPLSRGGLDVIENLRPAHRDCNTWKGAKPLEEYLEPPVDVELL